MPRFSARSGNAKVRPGREPLRYGFDEVDKRPPVALERRDRDPLLGPVVAGTGRSELDPRDARFEEADDVRGAVAADRDRLRARVLAEDAGEHAHVRVVTVHDRGLPGP